MDTRKGNLAVCRTGLPPWKRSSTMTPGIRLGAGFGDVKVSPRMVYVDASRPSLVDGFTKKMFIAMVAGVWERALATGMILGSEFDKGITDLDRTTDEDGTFCYTFFKRTAKK